MRRALFLLGWVGCTAPSMPVDTGFPDASDSSTTTDPVESTQGAPGVSGVLLGPSGQPLPDTEILCCTLATCFKSETDGEAGFWFALDAPVEVALKTYEDLLASPRLGAALEPARVEDGAIDAGTVYVPDLPEGTPLGSEIDGPRVLSAGDGLELTLDPAQLTPPLGTTLYDVAARRIPDAHVPDYVPLADEDVVAVYALHPFATTSAVPVAVKAPSDLDPGTEVRFRTISHLDGTFSDPVAGLADGTSVTTEPGAGVDLLTYVVISVP